MKLCCWLHLLDKIWSSPAILECWQLVQQSLEVPMCMLLVDHSHLMFFCRRNKHLLLQNYMIRYLIYLLFPKHTFCKLHFHVRIQIMYFRSHTNFIHLFHSFEYIVVVCKVI